MARYIDTDDYIKYCEDNCVPLNEYAVKAQPTVDVAPVVHARWENGRCTNCHTDKPVVMASVVHGYMHQYQGRLNYCPNCGARMDEE